MKDEDKKRYLQECRDILAKKGYILLTDVFVNKGTLLLIKCRRNHKFEFSSTAIKQYDITCPDCRIIDKYGELSEEEKIKRYQECLAIVTRKGGTLLTDHYEHCCTKMEILCEIEHYFILAADLLRINHSWCDKCNLLKELAKPMNVRQQKMYDRCKRIIEEAGGTIISTRYINNSVPIKYKCRLGHNREQRPACLFMGHLCSECSGMARITKEWIKNYIESKGGKWLDEREIRNQNDVIKVKCREEHVWDPLVSSMRIGTWCPFCAGLAKYTTEEMREILHKLNIRLVSPEFINTKTPCKLECELCGFNWVGKVGHYMYDGSTCMSCSGKIKRRTIEDMKEIVSRYGGEIVAGVENYKILKSILRCKCKRKHYFDITGEGLVYGRWCKDCRMSLGEREVEVALNELDIEFEYQVKTYIGKSLFWFDFYFNYGNKEYYIEFDGQQHFKRHDVFHESYEDFLKDRSRDIKKTNFALSSGVFLIRIDFKEMRNIRQHIENALQSEDIYYYSNREVYDWLIKEHLVIKMLGGPLINIVPNNQSENTIEEEGEDYFEINENELSFEPTVNIIQSASEPSSGPVINIINNQINIITSDPSKYTGKGKEKE